MSAERLEVSAIFANPCVSACMLLLAPELLSIAVRSGSAQADLGPIDITNGLVRDKLYGAVRASAAV